MNNPIEKKVVQYQSMAETHQNTCRKLLADGGLKLAIEYCSEQRITPPQCSLSAKTANAEAQRDKAERMLTEKKWWLRRLKNLAEQDFENGQREQGNVTNYVSPETLAYYNKKRRN